jgi:hypothetical protein
LAISSSTAKRSSHNSALNLRKRAG